MPTLVRPISLTVRQDGLGSGLASLWMPIGPYASGATVTDLVGPYSKQPQTATSADGWITGSQGNGVASWNINANSGRSVVFTGNDYSFEYNQPFTLVARFKTTSASEMGLIIKAPDSSPWNGLHFFMQSVIGFQFAKDGGGSGPKIRKTTNASYNDGAWHTAVISYDGAGNAAGTDFTVDGATPATTTANDNLGGQTTIVTTAFQLFGRGTSLAFNGQVECAAVYRRAISKAEAIRWHQVALNGYRELFVPMRFTTGVKSNAPLGKPLHAYYYFGGNAS